MLISVIIPFYKGNAYISELLQIVQYNRIELKKVMNKESEVIIVNDSPEDSVLVKNNDLLDGVTILNNPTNQGIHKSRVNGLGIAKGEYVIFLDQDDTISKHFFLSQLRRIDDNDFVVANGFKTSPVSKESIYATTKAQKATICLLAYYCYTCPIISPGQVMIKRSAIPKEWINNIMSNNGADDFYLWILLLEQGKRGTINEKHLYTHVYTGDNASLNIQKMRQSNLELTDNLQGNIAAWKINFIKRRTEYNCSYVSGIGHKLKFFDVCLLRLVFGKLLF